jgi:2-polyprenyl-6-methoxyphenol hydroxylase-like FAD-dependent oxidoreductase
VTYVNAKETDVLVVGGGLVGLASAMFLAWRGARVTLVERHAGSSPHPRAVGYTPRTMELLRAVGLGDRVPAAPAEFRLRRVRVESLAGQWFEESPWTDEAEAVMPSPCTGAAIAQDRLEPVLRDRARELGAELRTATELVRFTQDACGVTAVVRDADGETELRAAYMIAADGNRSPVRESLGIGRSGRGHIRVLRSVLFSAPLDEYLATGVLQFTIAEPDFRAFLTTYRDGRWVLFLDGDRDHTEAELRAAITRAIGRADLPVELLTTGRWELSALIADRFRDGRVFLAGDAAHTLPPSRGGFGANTGIEDAHNLACKLAAVLGATAGEGLLDTYDAERRPIAWLRHDQIFARQDYRADPGAHGGATIYPDAALELGHLYRSAAVIGAGPELPPAATPEAWRGQPGTRAPHVWLAPNLSTLDLVQRGWVVFSDDGRWGPTTTRIDSTALAAFGLAPGGAALVRPDGYIAWRAATLPVDPAAALARAIETCACMT